MTGTCTKCTKNDVCFTNLPIDDKALISSQVSLIDYKKNEIFFKQKTQPTHLVQIIDGLAKIYVEGPRNKNFLVKIALPGEVIGLTSIFQDQTYFYTATALKNSRICHIPKDILRQVLSKNGMFGLEFLKMQNSEIKFLYKRLHSLGTKQMHGRLADVIIELAKEQYNEVNIYNFISRSDLAEMCGMSKTGIVRLLTEYKNDGLINTDGKHIEINNMELMERLSVAG